MSETTDGQALRALHERKVEQVRKGYTDREVGGLAALALDMLSFYGSSDSWDDDLVDSLEDHMARACEAMDLPSLFDTHAWRRMRHWMTSTNDPL